ncbi:MFS transporter [Modestobacter sp. Leaf380]|uniref:MFS transporter n=1 Tax=Modestobacter sp. Leaf380 TaxID=1736356 RepID=UPI0006F3A6A0|nr:MFS transporter [Modestobacter sp. Leaf380]KQS63655.1 hypothetical protein ASG41_18635 [Modestobacter sp. Leaf380]
MTDADTDTTRTGTPPVAAPGTPPVAAPVAEAAMGRSFWALLGATFVASLGSGITFVAFPWLTTQLTRDPLLVAGAVVAAELPWLVFSLPVGVWVDRYEHRRLISSTHLTRALVIGLLAAAVLLDVTSLWMIYLVGFLLGSFAVMNENASQTILPSLVRPAHINRANSHLMLADTVGGTFLGPAIGGWLLLVSVSLPFALDAGLFAVAAALLVLVRPQVPAGGPAVVVAPPADRSLRTEMAAGMRFFWQHRVLRQLGIFLGLLNLASAVVISTQVLFAQEILGLGAGEYGLLFAVGAVGAATGSAVAPGLEDRFGPRRVLLGTLVGNVAVSTTIGLTSSALVVAAALLVAGSLAVIWNVVTISYRQRTVPGHMLGRVNSIYRLLAWGPLSIGSLIGGGLVTVAIPLVGREPALRVPLVVAAVLAAGLTGYAVLRLREGVWAHDPADVYPDADDTDRPARRGQPGRAARARRMTTALVAVNVLVAVVGLVVVGRQQGLTLEDVVWDGIGPLHLAGEMNGPAVDDGQVWRLGTASFLHYGLGHLAVNMLLLVLAGRRLEPVLGPARFLGVYLLSALGAGVATYLLDHGSLTAGASGAVFGLFAALLLVDLRLGRNPALAVGLVLVGAVTTFAVPGTAVAAHVGGFLVGAVLAGACGLRPEDRVARWRAAVPVAVPVVLVGLAVVAFLGQR